MVKPLVEKKDNTGIKHRDTALLEAIEQRQWDVVDYCQVYDADIDMKDEDGETPLNREARKREWKAVQELVVRSAYPNLLDKDGCSVMTCAIVCKQWDTVELLIEYQANIHTPAPLNRWSPRPKIPINLLIDQRQGELIHHTLMWCPNQEKGVNDVGETTLHAIVLDKNKNILYGQVVRGVDPLTLTKEGCSVLLYAVKNPHCPQRMVGKCLRLGFSTHQPVLIKKSQGIIVTWLTELIASGRCIITSPLLLAVVRGLFVVAQMLYESGSCSPSELLHLYEQMLELSDFDTDIGGTLIRSINKTIVRRDDEDYSGEYNDDQVIFNERRQRYEKLIKNITTFLPYLKEMVTTPRSLVSTCRLVISRCLTVRRRRERAVRQLTLPVRYTTGELVSEKLIHKKLPLPEGLKNYLLFSDLTDPDYAWYLFGRLPGTLPPLPPKMMASGRGKGGRAVKRS
jgi:hypothetical protein